MGDFDRYETDARAVRSLFEGMQPDPIERFHMENQFQYATIACFVLCRPEAVLPVQRNLRRFLADERSSEVGLAVTFCTRGEDGQLYDTEYLSGADVARRYGPGELGRDRDRSDAIIQRMFAD